MENKDKLYLHINVVMDRDTDKQEYFWNKISSYLESMGMECLGSSEYQPLERIPKETKESNLTPSEPLHNGKREERNKISKILVKYDMPTRQVAINEIMQLLSQSKKESYNEGYMECSEDNRFIEHYELCKKNGMDTVTMAKNARRIKDKIDTILGDIVDKAELESLTNQKKEDEK